MMMMMMMIMKIAQPPGYSRIRHFSTTAATKLPTESTTENVDAPSSSALSRGQKLKELRRQRSVREKEKEVQVALRKFDNLPKRSPQQFDDFFDAIMPPYTLSRMGEVLKWIKSHASSEAAATAATTTANSADDVANTPRDDTVETSEGDPLPLSHNLETALQTANPSDELQIHVLRFLLHDDREAISSRATLDVEEHVIDTLMAARHKSVVHPLFWDKQDLIHVNSQRLLAPLQKHQSKTKDQLHAEAKELALHLRNHLPTKYYKELVAALEGYVGVHEDKIDGESTPSSPPTTLQEIYEPERVDRPPLRMLCPILYRNLKSHFIFVGRDIARFFYLEPPEDDPDLIEAQKRWTDSREQFTTTLLDLQEKLKDVVRVDVAKKAGKVTKKKRAKHVTFQVDATENELPATGASVNRIFLENLPVDITEKEIRSLYSRCGPVRSVQIFNRRPDLDPGPLTRVQIDERRKKALKSLSAKFTKWQRPRTPVYSVVEFVEEEGYQRAIDDTLRIFGMIIRRHPVRSVPAVKVTSLHLENLSDGENCLEFQNELERVTGLQVSLEPGQNAHVLVGSCEIAFPSFDLAWEAYSKIQNIRCVKEGSGRVHWFRTPSDAEKWWTRERCFSF